VIAVQIDGAMGGHVPIEKSEHSFVPRVSRTATDYRKQGLVSMTPEDDAVRGYELAHDRAEYARSEWAKAGLPLVVVLANGVEAPHPLWRTLMQAESFLLRSRAGLKAADRRGRPVGSSSAPDRQRPKLKPVS
jgi:hypothetical protein